MDRLIQIEITGLEIEPRTNMPLVVLKVTESGRVFPLWTGIFEANAIALELERVKTPRPMTHDLIKDTVRALGGAVTHVALTDLRDHTFYATVFIRRDGTDVQVDSRPSDAFALALRFKAPIFVTAPVLSMLTTYDGSVDFKAELRRLAEEGGSS